VAEAEIPAELVPWEEHGDGSSVNGGSNTEHESDVMSQDDVDTAMDATKPHKAITLGRPLLPSAGFGR
jgi:hypothetical protein